MCNTLTCPVEGIDAGASPALTTDANYRPIIAYVERTVVSTVGSCHRALSVPQGPVSAKPAAWPRPRHRHAGTAFDFCAFRGFGLFESFTGTVVP